MKNAFRVACYALCLGSFASVASAQASSARWHNIRFADDFNGADASAKINAAIADCGAGTGAPGASCLVLIPPGMACGEPRQPPDHVVLWDLRGCAQSTGLRFNLAATTTGNVRSKMYIQDNFNAQTANLGPTKASATFYSASFVDGADVTRGTVAAINGSTFINRLNGDFSGHVVGIEGEAFAQIAGDQPRNITDIRGGTFNTLVGRNVNAHDVTSLVAQAPAVRPGGTIANAYSLRAEAPNAGTQRNLAGWFNGDVQVDTNLAVGKEMIVGGGAPIHKMTLGKAPLNYGMIPGHGCADQSMTVSGADPGGVVTASPSANIGQSLTWSGWVEPSGRVVIRVCNMSPQSASVHPSDWTVQVVR